MHLNNLKQLQFKVKTVMPCSSRWLFHLELFKIAQQNVWVWTVAAVYNEKVRRIKMQLFDKNNKPVRYCYKMGRCLTSKVFDLPPFSSANNVQHCFTHNSLKKILFVVLWNLKMIFILAEQTLFSAPYLLFICKVDWLF